MTQNKLPKDWKWISISEIAKIETGTTPSKAIPEYYGDEYPFYKPTDLQAGLNVYKSNDGLTKLGVDKARYVPENTTLVTCIGATIGKTGFIKKGGGFNQQINAIIPNENILPKFIYYQAIGLNFQKQIKDNASATTLPLLNKSKFQVLKMAICSLETQQLIVSKIEELFSELDKGIEDLKLAQQQLKTYRQSVLKYAFVNERFTNFILKNVTIKIQIGPFGTQLHKEDYIENGIPLINPTHIKLGLIVPNLSFTILKSKRDSLPNYILEIGDVIMGRRGEMGRCGLVSKKEEGWFCGTGSLFFRPDFDKVHSTFLYYHLRSEEVKKYLEENAGGTTMANLNLKIVNNIPISLPPIEEQYKIVEEIESRLSVADKMEESINQSLLQAEALRQSILKKAFEGKLI